MAFLAVLVSLLSLSSISGCRLPPSLWCSSLEAARECKVADQCWESQWSKLQGGQAEPVQFALYYEYLCPGCKEFITNQLYPTWTQISQIVNITLVPFGNAQETWVGDKWVFDCQHGAQECLGNMIETCAIHFLKDIKVYFPLIHCMEASNHTVIEAFEQCAKQLNVSISDIRDCTWSDLGNHLEHQMALQTEALHPHEAYVPWVTLNGMHNEEIQKKAENDLKSLLCETYLGVKPDACQTVQKKLCQKKF